MIVTVTRSGGFAGLVAQGELDTSTEPDAEQLEAAVRALYGAELGTGRPQPDRYVYRLEVRATPDGAATHHTIAEQDLNESTAWLLDRVLGQRS
ncbi:protealysin inhibitor emfourin [Kribbella albertanoniae]|uniref:protealysin inhibitor emfourin n=1 Tax=Kribbella albertanoniae TaxID=1266829 RepID=UPI0014054C61|nr:protealysin inhibitor emfourin [Kribbella albertanoniae]